MEVRVYDNLCIFSADSVCIDCHNIGQTFPSNLWGFLLIVRIGTM